MTPIQNYRLIKDYPGAPAIGYITNFNHNEEDWGAPNLIIVHDCKNYPEFWEPTDDKIVYKAESGTTYSYQDVLNLAKGNKEYADILIQRAEWAHIETMIDEDLREGEIEEVGDTYVLTGGED